MWIKSARQAAQVVEMEQLRASSALARYGNSAIRGLATGIVIGGTFVALYQLGFLKGVIVAAALVGLQWFIFKKR